MNADELESRIAVVDDLLKAHAGGLELESVSGNGEVVVRFTGMCTGCIYKPVTMAATVRRELMAVPGVRSVTAVGGRMSQEAEERLAYYLRDEAPSIERLTRA
jgi:Fe-S cluster biogenesis protein NfuA